MMMTIIINKYFLDHFWTFWTKKNIDNIGNF